MEQASKQARERGKRGEEKNIIDMFLPSSGMKFSLATVPIMKEGMPSE
jgi:hypothetical protein